MTILTLHADETACAIYEAATASDMAPFNDPVSHLASIHFHSSLDYYALAQPVVTKTINHLAVAADAGVGYSDNATARVLYYGRTTADYQLATHSLGFPPLFAVVDENGMALPAGFPIQRTMTGSFVNGDRKVCIYATSSDIRLYEIAMPGNAAMAAINKTYSVYVFRPPIADPDLPMLELSGSPIFGQGKFQASQQHLRRAVSETPGLFIPNGRRTDIANGTGRYVQGDGTVLDMNSSTVSYTGSFSPASAIPAVAA